MDWVRCVDAVWFGCECDALWCYLLDCAGPMVLVSEVVCFCHLFGVLCLISVLGCFDAR